MAQVKGTNVASPVVPFDTTDVHPSHEARYGRGGYRTVATTAERDAIPAPRREAGMLVYVTADETIYTLAADLTTWAALELGGGQPDAHAATHSATGSDPVTLTVAQVAGLQTALDGKQAVGTYATLVGGKVPPEQLPSYVDDILEAANLAALPGTGAAGVLYVAMDTNKVYRWSGSTYVEVSAGASAWADITGKPTFAAVATSGAYSDLTGTPAAYSLPTATGSVLGGVKIGSGVTITDGVISVSTNYAAASHTHSALADITGLATVATSGAYADLTGRPTLGTAAAAATTDFAAASHTQAWTTLTGTPTTLAGYGITDAQKTITSGTAAPTGGVDGDIYLQYT